MKQPLSTDARNDRSGTGTRLLVLTLTGGGVFWIVSFFTSLLPLAAAYRAAYSDWSRQTVWIGAAFMGLLFCAGISALYVRLFEKIPAKQHVFKALLISAAVLTAAVLAINLPMALRLAQTPLRYFLLGVALDAARFLLAGLAIGLLDSWFIKRADLGIERDR